MGRTGRIGAAVAILAVAVALGLLFLRNHGPSPGAANGSYTHDCCGTVTLSDGRMLLGQKKSVTYEVGEDEAGAYVLPATFVGTWEDRGFEIDGSRAPVRLRLDKFPRPDSITLPAPRGAYLFKRKEFKVPAKPT